MGKRFLHNRAAVVTVAFVLLIALIGILAPLLRRTISCYGHPRQIRAVQPGISAGD